MTRDDDFLLTNEERRLRKRKRRRILVGGIALLLLVVLIFFLARPASHAIKGWQARRHAAKASHLIDEEKWADAQKEVTAAMQLKRTEPQAVRAVARFLTRTRQPGALDFWKQFEDVRKLSRFDLRDEAMAALTAGNMTTTGAAVDKLLGKSEGGPKAADWLLAAQLAAKRNEVQEVVRDLDRAVADLDASERQLLQISILQLTVADAAQDAEADKMRSAAQARLVKLAQAKDAVGLDALTVLAERKLLEKAEKLKFEKLKSDADATAGVPPITKNEEPITASALAEALDSHPLAKAPQHLLAVDLRISTSLTEKEQLIQGAVERWKKSNNEPLAALAKWLNGKGEFELELKTVPLPRALQTRDLFLQHVDALGALGRWDEIRHLLESERFPLEPTVAHMYLARCYAQLGQKTASANNWQRALESANGDPQKLMTVADYARKNGVTDVAARAYDRVIAAAPQLRAAWHGKLQLAQTTGNIDKIHVILVNMLKLWPSDPAIENDEAYTKLLLLPKSEDGTQRSEEKRPFSESDADLRSPTSDVREIERKALDLVQREPASLPHRTLLALVYLKENRPATALGVYENLSIPANALTPSALAVHAAVLAANGYTAAAAKEAAQIPRRSLLPEEAALLAKRAN